MKYRRSFSPGGTFFFTQVTYKRRPIFSTPQAVEHLRRAFRYTMPRMPFTIVASVILPDHMHFIWTLPPENSDFSTRWRLIKSHFTRNWCAKDSVSENASRVQKGEKDVWQRRFWEHLIRDELDLIRHVEYIHYNPVKHGLVDSPGDWEYSSFMKYVREDMYPLDWGGNGNIWEGEGGMEEVGFRANTIV
jgi:putative transposase